MTTMPLISTEDDATARRWAAEAGLLACVQSAIEGGGVNRFALFRARIGNAHIVIMAWWGWANAAENGLAAHRSDDAALINRLVAIHAEKSRIQCAIHGRKWKWRV